ncbi:MAG TPA: 3-isopropylmalate dehydratase/homoaconitate hydratase family large subunit [Trueperaceae bacterium]|nr:3-isopropylmalate dehydratase/homoaconitate hydratase family large subunit [Trueperaceae bacterium]
MSAPAVTGERWPSTLPADPGIELAGLSLAERILSVKAGRRVRAGEVVVVPVDQVMMVDSIAPSALAIVEDELGGVIQHPERVSVVIDHVAPASNVQVATTQKRVRAVARDKGLRLFDVGRGICHQVLMEEGLARPGWVVVGSDSHSTTYGAVSAFGTGMGATDIALAMVTGRTWLKVPETVRVRLTGVRGPGVAAKDVALEIVRRLTADGATYASIEILGAESFGPGERMTLANLAVEAGAKVGLVAPDEALRERYEVPPWLVVDQAAEAFLDLEIDLGEVGPLVSVPFQVDNVHPVGEHLGVHVDQVFVGTCTNGRLEDLHEVVRVLAGRTVADGTRLLVIPASSRVLQDALADGTIAALVAAGASVGVPGCGPCMGRHMGVLAPGEVCVSTSNRNFMGRMGSPEARIYLASPAVAAASAAAGVVAMPEQGADA